MPTDETLEKIKRIKVSTQYRILTPEIKVLIELYPNPGGLYTNQLARRLEGHISKSTIQKALMHLDDQSLIKTRIGFVNVAGTDHLAKISRIAGEKTKRYVEKLVDAIIDTLPTI